jgi:hypothetical protein
MGPRRDETPGLRTMRRLPGVFRYRAISAVVVHRGFCQHQVVMRLAVALRLL